MKLLLLLFFLAGFLIVTPSREFAKLKSVDWLVLLGMYAVVAGLTALNLWATREGKVFFGLGRRGWIIGMAVTYLAGLVFGILQAF